MIIRNWKQATPTVEHGTTVEWKIVSRVGTIGDNRETAVLKSHNNITRAVLQPGFSEDLQQYSNAEKIIYVVSGFVLIWVDGQTRRLKEGDAVYIGPGKQHQLLNNEEDPVEFITFSADI